MKTSLFSGFGFVAGLATLGGFSHLVDGHSSEHCGWPSSLHCWKHLPHHQSLGGTYNVSIESGKLNRSYLVTIPQCYYSQFAAPVILSYHGATRNSSYQLDLDQFTDPQFNKFAIVVHPQGINELWEGSPEQAAGIDDIQFTSDILDELEKLYCIDPTRIWAAGKSVGGGFVNVLACDHALSQRIAAFAAVSGAFYVDSLPCNARTVALPCSPGRAKIPMLEIHGGNDTTISYEGGERKNGCLPAVPYFVEEWALRNHLPTQSSATNLTNDTVLESFGKGLETGLVSHIFDQSIGHDWPSTVPNDDNSQPDHSPASYNATPLIIDFFKSYSIFLT